MAPTSFTNPSHYVITSHSVEMLGARVDNLVHANHRPAVLQKGQIFAPPNLARIPIANYNIKVPTAVPTPFTAEALLVTLKKP